MKTIYSDDHRLHDLKGELYGGKLGPAFEKPERADHVLSRVNEVALGPVEGPRSFGLAPLKRIHDEGFLSFLESCWQEWQAEGFEGDAIATVWAGRTMRQRIPEHIEGKLGYYAMAAETAICSGTWQAVRASADVALTGQAAVQEGARSAFALCRPPGHHAAADLFGGYCFLNNAAIAAQAFLDGGAGRVAILDVDFHHGNGTQSIFYDRDDVLFCSLHGDPRHAFPHFLGYGDETGAAAGEGFTANFPLLPGAAYDQWGAALQAACAKIADFGPDAVVVSLGVDTFERDPISFFKLTSEDFSRYGETIAKLGRPTLFVMEGGYAVEEIGINAVNVLTAFEQAA
ncbi:MAG: histone deacetylase family protein [Pseudomonadota bacterium]